MGRHYCENCGRVGCDDDDCSPKAYKPCECGGTIEILYDGYDKFYECDTCFKRITKGDDMTIGSIVNLKNTGDPKVDGTPCMIIGLPREGSLVYTLFGDFPFTKTEYGFGCMDVCFEEEHDPVIAAEAKAYLRRVFSEL